MAGQLDSVMIGQHSAAEVRKHLEKLLGAHPCDVQLSDNSDVAFVLKATGYRMPPDGGSVRFQCMTESFYGHEDQYISFSKQYPHPPPGLMIGINRLDFPANRNLRVKASVDEITSYLFRLTMTAEKDTCFDAGITWFTPPQWSCLSCGTGTPQAALPNFQMGTLNTSAFYSWEQPQKSVMRKITFTKPYPSDGPLPAIVVWLNELDLDKRYNRRIHAVASKITYTGFELTITTWSTTIMYSAAATWVAYPSDRRGIYSGNVSGSSGRVDFPPKHFGEEAPRKVLLGLNLIDVCSDQNTRVEMAVQGVTSKGMGWKIGGWVDTVVYELQGAFIALA